MKRIGVLYGRERAFPQALMEEIGRIGGDDVTAEPLTLDGVTEQTQSPCDLVVDRISHDVEFYRAALTKFAFDGVVVVPPPGNGSSPDRWQITLQARRLGVPTPRRAVLPSQEHPADVTPESLSNLRYPISWTEIFEQIEFPAVLRPLRRRADEPTWTVSDPDEFFRAYHQTGSEVMVLEEKLDGQPRVRCLVVGSETRILSDRGDGGYGEAEELGDEVRDLVATRSLALAEALHQPMVAFDFVVRGGEAILTDVPNVRPLADPEVVGEDSFRWLVERSSRWLVDHLGAGKPAPAASARKSSPKKNAAPRKKVAPKKKAASRKRATAKTTKAKAKSAAKPKKDDPAQ